MTTADQLALVEAHLNGEARALALAEAGLVQGWIKTRRMLVVAEPKVPNQGPRALLVLSSASYPVSSSSDLSLERAVAIDAGFGCDIDSGGDSAVLLKVGGDLMFEMLPGYHTQNLVAEIYKQTEAAGKKGAGQETVGATPAWATKFLSKKDKDSQSIGVEEASMEKRSASPFSALVHDMASTSQQSNQQQQGEESPESSLNRQDIATGGAAPIAARESIVKYQMSLKEEQYTSLRTFTVFVGTWNVNGQSPGGERVSRWLADEMEEPPDVYAVGFQELDLSKEAFVFNESVREDEWREAVAAALHPAADYRQVRLVRLVGMMLVVFVRAEHEPFVSNVASEVVGTGIMGKLGNKGGVAIRMDFHNTSVCFVCSHLAAHVSECERRNQDYHDICARTQFAQFRPARGIKDHDMVYWLGDLNYRISDMDAAEVKESLKANELKELMASDQFFHQRAMRKIFVGYREGEINFPPTYKFDPGTNDWDSSEKARAPAWTDRVLWRGDHIEQASYRSHMSLVISDHKPVSSVFKADMKVVDRAAYRRVYEDVMKKLDRLENEFLPQVTVETTEVAFDGEVRFLEPRVRSLTVANTGQVPVQFEFIRKLDDEAISKPWLTVEPASGFVMPGEKADVSIEVLVDRRTAGALNCGKDQLYDILVLHLVGGKDIFVTVSGEYRRSCFGSSIDALCRMTVPIVEVPVAALLEYEGCGRPKEGDGKAEKKKEEEEEPYPVPKELWFLCDLLTTLGLDYENLFLQQGLRAEVLQLRDWLDTGLPADPPAVSVHSASETLLLFLDSLREPVVPFAHYQRCLDSSSSRLQSRQAACALPARHRRVFEYVTAFLREIAAHSAKNGADAKIVATLFAGVLLRDPPGVNLGSGIRARTQQQFLDHKKAKFVYHFLVSDQEE